MKTGVYELCMKRGGFDLQKQCSSSPEHHSGYKEETSTKNLLMIPALNEMASKSVIKTAAPDVRNLGLESKKPVKISFVLKSCYGLIIVREDYL